MKETKTHYILTDEEHGNDMVTSYHAYLMNEGLPEIINVLDKHLKLVLGEKTENIVVDYKSTVEKLLSISKELGSRRYAFQTED